LAAIASLIVSCLGGPAAAAETKFVWKIKATWPEGTVELTGFSVKNQRGIYTALHGVVGAKKILVLQPHLTARQMEVRMAQADVANDVAFLVSTDDGVRLDDAGFDFLESPSLKMGDKFRIIGFPINLDLLPSDRELTLEREGNISLTLVLNPQARAVLGPRVRSGQEVSHFRRSI
jgi:hypothetical protein